MIKRIETCDRNRIEEYLSGSMAADESSDFETHLSECETCRVLIEEVSAEHEVWEAAKSFLGSSVDTSVFSSSQGVQDKVTQPGMSVLDMLAPTDDPEMLGRLGEYEVSGVVGVGGMGAVLRGFDKSLRRVVAIKVMAPHLAGSGPARIRFQREARAAAAITHDNVIDIYGVHEANDLPYLVMPYARGPSLQTRIDEGGPLSAVEVVRIGMQIASGLAAAHEQGLVHRDIKPANILLNEGVDRLWITDFGVARAIDDVSMTNTGLIAGTPQYMSPEQARGEFVDHRSDLFSLGSILYTACTGRPPFRSEAAYGVLRKITDTDPRPIREVNADIPIWLTQLINRLMAKHPADRFQTASEVAELLENCLAHMQQPTQFELPTSLASSQTVERLTVAETTETSPSRVVSSRSLKQRGILTMIGTIICLTAGAVAFVATGPDEIEGSWQGKEWSNVLLSSTPEAPGWYTGSFVDAAGNKGVLHLEWARLQQRYNGRWRVGKELAGQITLRGDIGGLRGAITLDPDSATDATIPRLRDFSWQPGKPVAVKAEDLGEKASKSYFEARAPVEGILSKLNEELRKGSKIERGQYIASISTDVDVDALAEQKRFAEREIQNVQSLLEAKEKEVEVATKAVDAAAARVDGYRATKKKVDEAAVAGLRTKMDAVMVATDGIKEYEDKVALAEKAVQYAQKNVDTGLMSIQEFNAVKAELTETKIKVKEAKSAVNRAELDVKAEEASRQVKLQEAETKIRDAIADQNEAEAELARAKTGVVEVKSQMISLLQELDSVERSLSAERRVDIISPVDGKVESVKVRVVGQSIVKGQQLLRIEVTEKPEGETKKQRR